jgi:hypothetical protein
MRDNYEIELFSCGVRVRVAKYLVDEFNELRLLLIQLHDGDNVPPLVLKTLDDFCIAKQVTNKIIRGLMRCV